MGIFLGEKEELIRDKGRHVLIPVDIKYDLNGEPLVMPRMPKGCLLFVGFVSAEGEDICVCDDLEELKDNCRMAKEDGTIKILLFYFGKKEIADLD